jgi:hypothetical protein
MITESFSFHFSKSSSKLDNVLIKINASIPSKKIIMILEIIISFGIK